MDDYSQMKLDELRQYALSHRDDEAAFQAYIDRSKAEGRMTVINPTDPDWEEKVTQMLSLD
jgi:hypothetical protein